MFNQNDTEKKLDWMYKGANSLVDREEYLLGRTVDKSLEQLNAEEKQKQLGSAAPPKNHVEHECIPPSIRDYKLQQQLAEQVDLQAKLQEDPLLMIKKQEEETRRQFLQNPVQLKKLQKALSKQERKSKHKRKEYLDEILLQKLKLLQKNSDDLEENIIDKKAKKEKDLDIILMHKFNALKSKLSEEDLKDIMDGKFTDSSDSENENDSETKDDSKRTFKEKAQKKKKEHKKKKKSRKSRKRDKSSSSSSDSDSGSDSESPDERTSKKEKRRNKEDKLRRESSSEESIDERRKRSKRNEQRDKREKYKMQRRGRSASQENRSRSRKKEKRERSRSPKKTKATNATKRRSRTRSRSRSRSKDKRRLGPERPPTKYSHSQRAQRSDDSDDNNSHQKIQNWGLVKSDGTQIALSRRSRSTSRERRERRRIQNKLQTANSKEDETTVQKSQHRSKRLSSAEKEELLREMRKNADEQDVERAKNIRKYRAEDAKEARQRDFDEDFARKEYIKSTNSSTVESRIKANLNNIQRGKSDMNSHFSRRH